MTPYSSVNSIMRVGKLLLIVTSLALVFSCNTSPTGRKQLLLLPEQQLAEQGVQAFTQIKKETPLSESQQQIEYVNCIAERLIKVLPDGTFSGEWEVQVFDSDAVNAFALPGGKIGVYTGLIDITDNADQLAAVIGHEIGHVIARHGNERVSQNVLAGVATDLTKSALELGEVANQDLILGALGLGIQYGVALPFSRSHESEADSIGLMLMADAAFDPRQSVNLWQNMAAANEGKQPPEWLSTHPSAQTRIQRLQAEIPTALMRYTPDTATSTCVL